MKNPQPPERSDVFVLRVNGQEIWKVRWRGQITTPDFNSRDAAMGYLNGLTTGRRPELRRT